MNSSNIFLVDHLVPSGPPIWEAVGIRDRMKRPHIRLSLVLPCPQDIHMDILRPVMAHLRYILLIMMLPIQYMWLLAYTTTAYTGELGFCPST